MSEVISGFDRGNYRAIPDGMVLCADCGEEIVGLAVGMCPPCLAIEADLMERFRVARWQAAQKMADTERGYGEPPNQPRIDMGVDEDWRPRMRMLGWTLAVIGGGSFWVVLWYLFKSWPK